MRVLPRDQQAVGNDMRCPVRLLREDGAQSQHLIFDQKGHDLGKPDGFFFAVGEAGHLLALDQNLSVRRLDVTQRARGMTHDGNCLTRGKEGLDQLHGVLVFGEIPHRAVATRIEDGIEVLLLDAVETNGLVELSFRSGILFEANGKVSAEFRFIALRIKRRPATLRGREDDLSSGVLENVVGGGEFFEPEARLSSGVTQLVVRCDHHQHLHLSLLGWPLQE
jgi:hypothetical protein